MRLTILSSAFLLLSCSHANAFRPKSVAVSKSQQFSHRTNLNDLGGRTLEGGDALAGVTTDQKVFSTRGGLADNGRPDWIAPSIYAVFTFILIDVIYDLRDVLLHDRTKTLGYWALAFVTGALIWDNFVITIGSIFFRDASTNKFKHNLLKILSLPRFTFHSFATPLECITIAEMGKFAGVGFLQKKLVTLGITIGSFALGIYDLIRFYNSPGIKLNMYDDGDTPPDALERDLIKFSMVKKDFSFVVPAIILSLFTLVTGIFARKKGDNKEVATWLIFAALSALIGNVLPGPIMTFSGNLGEAGLQYGLLEAAKIVYA